MRALEADKISNYWVETGSKINENNQEVRTELTTRNSTGRYSPLSENLWRAGPGFRDNHDLLLTQKSVELVMDEHINFLKFLTTFSSVAQLVYDPATTLFLIPGIWVIKLLIDNNVISLHDTNAGGDDIIPPCYEKPQWSAFAHFHHFHQRQQCGWWKR